MFKSRWFSGSRLFSGRGRHRWDLAAVWRQAFKWLAGWRLVWQPLQPCRLTCGLAGIVAFKKKPVSIPPDDTAALSIAALKTQVHHIRQQGAHHCLSAGQSLAAHYLCGPDVIQDLLGQVQALKQIQWFHQIYNDPKIQAELQVLAGDLNQVLEQENRSRQAQEGRLEQAEATILVDRLEQLRDMIWCLTYEIQQNIEKINALRKETATRPERAVIQRFKELNAVLNSLERLEVRGRDSAGLALLVTLTEKSWQQLQEGLTASGLMAEYQARAQSGILLNRTLRVCRPLNGPEGKLFTLSLTYKIAAEVGALGDNTAFIRQQIRQDGILQQVLELPHWQHHSLFAHTRWASVGAVTEINCHPLDNESVNESDAQAVPDSNFGALLQVCLNGDIDNYQELQARLATQGVHIPETITTDTQIIPLQIQYYLQQQDDIVTAFRRALNDFTGSHAIALQTSLAPGQLLLGQRGSGQALYVGLGPDFYMAASEVYGLIEEATRYLKLEGGPAGKITSHGSSEGGQIYILQQTETGGLSGLQAMDYAGHPLEIDESILKTSPITSRDIDRQAYPHYFLKEISEAPQSVARTLQHRWHLTADGQEMEVVLDQAVVPEIVKQRLQAGTIQRICFVGQGTAGVAAAACADITAACLNPARIQVQALKASELSGYRLPETETDDHRPMQDTLVVAISQSGTTTDTNRAVDLVRQQGAATLAIVNRRDSDLTFKVDGVMYTSSGRDIEMSVASTKAFYGQVVAGAMLGLYLAQLLRCQPPAFITSEIRQLLALPDQMRQVLQLQEDIAHSARRLALTRTYWAAVGSGPNKAAADEIRIKLSELCYKTISSDYVEDKKHIDLSSEPLIIVCAAGSRGTVIGDIIKDTAIFQAHRALPVVIADAGELRFAPYSADVFYVPVVAPHLAPILNTLVGHLWGYHAALTINASSQRLFDFREALQQLVARYTQDGLDLYEIILEKRFRETIATFYAAFRQEASELCLPSGTDHNVISDLLLLLKYLSGRLPVADFEMDFGCKGTALNMLNALLERLGTLIAALSRPVDAIRHQAKTVTVGTSRIAEPTPLRLQGVLFDALSPHGLEPAQLTNTNILVLKNLQEIVAAVQGTILYAIEGLNLLGEPGEQTTIRVVRKTGLLTQLASRVENDNRLKGTKRIIVREGNVFIGKGRSDQRNIIIIPVLSAAPAASQIQHLLLLNIDFKSDVPLATRIRALGGKYERIKNIVQENSLSWQDTFIETLNVEMLFGVSAEKTAEYIVANSQII